jgi:hypothetical protein
VPRDTLNRPVWYRSFLRRMLRRGCVARRRRLVSDWVSPAEEWWGWRSLPHPSRTAAIPRCHPTSAARLKWFDSEMRGNAECARNRWACDRVIVSCWSLGRGRVRSGRVWRSGPGFAVGRGRVSNTEIAELVGVLRPTVVAWRDRYVSSGMQGLHDEQRSGRPRTVDRGEILAARSPRRRRGWVSRIGRLACSRTI